MRRWRTSGSGSATGTPIWDFSTGAVRERLDRRSGDSLQVAALPAGESQVWGFNAMRTNRWKNELSFLAPTPQALGQGGIHMASRAAHVVGLTVPRGLEESRDQAVRDRQREQRGATHIRRLETTSRPTSAST